MKRSLIVCLVALLSPALSHAGEDLRLSYRSPIDDTDQPYRLFVPAAYDGRSPLPLVVTLHGTSGNQNTMFDSYGNGQIKRVAEQRHVFVLSPLGRGVTEYRGIGENDVLWAIDDVRRRYRIDDDRIYCTGHSMGGTGAAYLAYRHPQLFAAIAPLAAAYSFPWLAENAQHVPSWWILGGNDYHAYITGAKAGAHRMIDLGFETKLTILDGRGHGDWVAEKFDEVFAWLLTHKRTAHPRRYTHVTETPMHGSAYVTSIDAITTPGLVARLSVRITDHTITLTPENVASLALLPDGSLLPTDKPVRVIVNDRTIFDGLIDAHHELRCTISDTNVTAAVADRRNRDLRQWRINPVGTAAQPIIIDGVNSPLGTWIADAMREATHADVAVYGRLSYRGLPIPQGRVDIVDLIQASRPFEQYLVMLEVTTAQLLTMLDDNITDQPAKAPVADTTLQPAGFRYTFDRTKPRGQRIVSSTLDRNRTYKLVMEGHAVEREKYGLGSQYGQLKYTLTPIPFTAALYAHALRQGQNIAAPDDLRVISTTGH
jgi:pimeloyl-ACP methyl ester carboxylesterase